MIDFKQTLPRQEAWDAESDETGWAVSVADVKGSLELCLAEASKFRSDEALSVLTANIESLIAHLS